jgi:hypothetical protein
VPDIVKFLIRVPSDVWGEIKAWATDEDRSMNQQVVHILKRALAEWRKP